MNTECYLEQDDKRIKEMFPIFSRRIVPLVERECDWLDYEGSRIFDEYPDRYMMQRIIDKVYQEVSEMDQSIWKLPETPSKHVVEDEVFASDFTSRRPSEKGSLLRELIGVLLYHEIYSRRCRNSCCKQERGFF